MIEDMQLRGLSARTQEAYARAVWQLALHYHRSPEQLSDEECAITFSYVAILLNSLDGVVERTGGASSELLLWAPS